MVVASSSASYPMTSHVVRTVTEYTWGSCSSALVDTATGIASLITESASAAASWTATALSLFSHLSPNSYSPQFVQTFRSTWWGSDVSFLPSNQQSMHRPSRDSSQSLPHLTQKLTAAPPVHA